MDLIEQIQAALSPVPAGGAWYGMNTAEPPAYPYITWQPIVSTTNNTLSGASDLQNTRIQIDIVALKVADLPGLDDAVGAAMSAAPFQSLRLSSQDIPEPEIKAFRRTIDFSVWSTLSA